MYVVFLGPPGAGKGTQAELLAEARGVPHLSTGDMLRAARKSGTPVGERARQYMDDGELVPDVVVDALVAERLARPDCASGWLLDGYPRNIEQAHALARIVATAGTPLTAVLSIAVADDVIVARLTGRRTCRECGAIYHLDHQPPAREGTCDRCGGRVVQRQDDTERVVRERLRVYHANTEPLVQHYAAQGKLREIDGDRPVAEIQRDINAAVGADPSQTETAS